MPYRRVAVAFNTARSHYDGYRPGDPVSLLLEPGDQSVPVLFTVEAADTQDALDQMWEIGNRIRGDSHGRRWAENVRSLSTGDVLVVYPRGYPPAGGTVESYAVARVGFDPIGVHHVPSGGTPRLTGPPATHPDAASTTRESL